MEENKKLEEYYKHVDKYSWIPALLGYVAIIPFVVLMIVGWLISMPFFVLVCLFANAIGVPWHTNLEMYFTMPKRILGE